MERRRAQLEESVARYLAQLDTIDRQEPTEALAAKTKHLKEKLVKLKGEMDKLSAYERQMLASPDQQISLTDPDSRSMARNEGRGGGAGAAGEGGGGGGVGEQACWRGVYRCPAGERLKYRYSNEEDGKELRRYWTTACPKCPLKSHCTTGPERRITRWEYEQVLEAVQQRLDANPPRCASGARRSSIRSELSRPGWAQPTS